MTSLKNILVKRINAVGPLSIADYMRECLMHPQYGYYQQREVFGAKGDFITAPEISQMFGEIIGLWCIKEWQRLGSPKRINLVELGPGLGTLMQDIRRASAAQPGFLHAAQIHFIEASAQLRKAQAIKHPDAAWHSGLADVPPAPTIIIANEFFDALPIHQFVFQDGLWFERAVVANEVGELIYSLQQPGGPLALLTPRIQMPEPEQIYEVSPLSLTIAGEIAAYIKAQSGSALIIDYGYAHSIGGDTFQALRDHRYTDPLSEPGLADLTAHVAFDQLAAILSDGDLEVSPLETHGGFLMGHGIGLRAQALAKGADEQTQRRLLGELKRLTAPDQMGELFKVLVARD